MIYKDNLFEKGIDAKYNREFLQGVDRLHRLQNARLFKRGEMGYVSRIEGYQTLLESTDISDPLDVIEHKGSIFILSKDSEGNFVITITDDGGNVQNTIEYTDTDTDYAELSPFEEYIYVAPHNRFLYEYDGQWYIKEFISTVPVIANVEPHPVGDKAQGSIEVQSGFREVPGSKAFGHLFVLANTIPFTTSRTFRVRIGDDRAVQTGGQTGTYWESDPITVTGSHKRQEIANMIVDAINNTEPISEVWEASINGGGLLQDSMVRITAKSVGKQYNNYEIYVVGNAANAASTRSDRNNRTRSLRTTGLAGSSRIQQPDGRSRSSSSTDISHSDTIMPFVLMSGDSTKGGKDTSNNEPVRIEFQFFGGQSSDTQFRVTTPMIGTSATATSVATTITTSLNNHERFSKYYTASRSGTTINIEALRAGDDLNTNIGVHFTRRTGSAGQRMGVVARHPETSAGNHVKLSTKALTGGNMGIGTLEPDTTYWYKVRFVYDDGHTTMTSFPVAVNTGNFRGVIVEIDDSTVSDIYKDRPIIEVFRKKDGEDFSLVDSIRAEDSLTYIDDGTSNLRILDEIPYLWTKKHSTQSFLKNRYVRANVEYNNIDFEGGTLSVTPIESTVDNILPKHSTVNVYTRPLYEDGTYGFHERIDKINVDSDNQKLQITQDGIYKDVKELGFYIESSTSRVARDIQFNSSEISGPNIPTIESIFSDDEDFYPNRTNILYGYKYLVRIARENNVHNQPGDIYDIDSVMTVVYDNILRGTDERENRRFFIYDYEEDVSFNSFNDKSPEIIEDVRIFNTNHTYIRIASHERMSARSIPNSIFDRFTVSVYMLANAEAIKEAAASGQLFLKVNQELSNFKTSQTKIDLNELNIRVIGAIDNSGPFAEVTTIDRYPYVLPPLDSRIYLQLEESPLDDIDDTSLLISEQKEISVPQSIVDSVVAEGMPTFQLDSITNADYTMSFDLFSLTNIGEPELLDSAGEDRQDYKVYNWREQKMELYSGEFKDLPLMYIGKKSNEPSTVTLDYTPFRIQERNNLLFTSLKENTISESIVTREDVTRVQTEYTNQLIWSEPVVMGSFSSGTRNFLSTSFYNLPTDNGKIQKIVEFNGRLYAFCERGIAVLFVGEVVSEQMGGEMFVDTSRFITDHRWIIESMKRIHPETIIKFETSIFCSDGYDVFMITPEGFQNISQGAIEFSGSECIASVDPLNLEYRISDCKSGQTWAYSFESGQWFGPYTYADNKSTFFEDTMVSVIGNKLVKHNTGNTFDGTSYETIIESVANDLDDPVATKLYRRFYTDTTKDATFSYSKDYQNWVSKQLSNTRRINGQYRIGINKTVRNQPGIYWRVTTSEDGFTLRNVAFELTPRRRI